METQVVQTFGQLTSVYFNINFVAKMLNFGKKCNFGRNVDFCHIVSTTTESNYDLAKMLIFRKMCKILIENSIFLRKCSFVHKLFFIKVFHLFGNCYFD